MLLERAAEQLGGILALDAGRAEALGPLGEDAVVDALLAVCIDQEKSSALVDSMAQLISAAADASLRRQQRHRGGVGRHSQAGVAEGEPDRERLVQGDLAVLVPVVVINEPVEALGAEVKQRLARAHLLLLRPGERGTQIDQLVQALVGPTASPLVQSPVEGARTVRLAGGGYSQTVLCLSDLKLALALEVDVADPEVGPSEVNREVGALLVAGGPPKHVRGEHSLHSIESWSAFAGCAVNGLGCCEMDEADDALREER